MNELITKLFLIVTVMLLFPTCEQNPDNNWTPLFDGTSTKGWRAYNGKKLPPGWMVIDSTLTFTSEQVYEHDYDYRGSRDIIYGDREFENFELYLEWKIPLGGNSGVFYHIKEGYDSMVYVAPEYQIIDDKNYAKVHNIPPLQDWQKSGSDYAMYPADDIHKILHSVGQWNTTRIIFTEEKTEYWLNGVKMLSFIPWSDEWKERKESGKWKDFPDYGKYRKGYIGLQDHGSGLAFRNIKIKIL